MFHSKTKFQPKWFNQTDANGKLYKLWCQYLVNSPYEAKCIVCGVNFNVANGGVAALYQHSKGLKHKNNASVRFKHEKDQNTYYVQKPLTSFVAKVETVQENDINVPSGSGEIVEHKSKDQDDVMKLTIPPPPSDSLVETPGVCKWISLSEAVAKAEAMWAIKAASSNYSFNSCNGLPALFQEMFPDSAIAKQFAISHQKTSYMISYGLKPYFQNVTVKDVLNSGSYFTIHFDETVTSQSKKQMDILIRYWSEKSDCIQVRYLCSLFFGYAFAKVVCKCLLECIQDLNMPIKKLLSLSADGPNVNKSIKAKMDDVLREAGAWLVDAGFCFIHKVHNGFKAGNTVFGMQALDFAMNIFTWFHLYPAREEDFKFIQDDENLENLKFLRHVDSRWLSLVPAVERIHTQMPAIKNYFTVFIPKKEKRSTKIRKFKEIHEVLTKHEAELLVEMAFLESVKPLFDSFLTVFPVEGPLIHMLYPSLVDMLRQIMNRFVKPDLVRDKTGKDLAQVDVSKTENQLPDQKVNIEVKTREYLKKMSPLKQKECMMGIRQFFSKYTTCIQERLPYGNVMLKSLPCLHPDMRQAPSSEAKMATVASNLPCCMENEIPLVIDEWKIYKELDIPKHMVTEKGKDGIEKPVRIDKYWGYICGLKTVSGNPRFKILPASCFLVHFA